jgi:hypothetical protein
MGALPDGTEVFAKICLRAFRSAALTVNHFGQDLHSVEPAPQRCRLCSQRIVIADGREKCVAFFAVQAAVSYVLFHFFISSLYQAIDVIQGNVHARCSLFGRQSAGDKTPANGFHPFPDFNDMPVGIVKTDDTLPPTVLLDG